MTGPEAAIRHFRERGLSDSEIVEQFESGFGKPMAALHRKDDGAFEWDLGEFRGAFQHRLLRELLAETPRPTASRPLTAYQAEKIPLLEAEAARLRRSTKRGPSDAALERAVGVDRGTIATWRKAGLLKP